jgi:hypothetical protein
MEIYYMPLNSLATICLVGAKAILTSIVCHTNVIYDSMTPQPHNSAQGVEPAPKGRVRSTRTLHRLGCP